MGNGALHSGHEFAGRYRIEGKIGKGGMGVVYRATDLQLERPVALKVLADSGTDEAIARSRFLKEIAVAAEMTQHPHIVSVFDGGIEEGRFYFTMQLIEGPDLGSLCASGPVEPRRAVPLLRQVCDALRFIHKASYVHRDIKPTNVLIWEAGAEWESAQLADFGIVRALEEDSLLTRFPPGSPAYMAPESVGWQPSTPLTDQYSLAVMAFEMLSGRRPFADETVPLAHCDQPVPSLSDAAPGLPSNLCATVERALAKDPQDRFPNIEVFGEELGPRQTPIETPSVPGHKETGLVDEVIAVLNGKEGWVEIAEVAKEINARGRYRPPSGEVTADEIDRRTETFSRRFRRQRTMVRLRSQS